MWRKTYSKVLKKRKQKSSMRLCDRVIVREWVQNKSHHYVHESRTFSKGLTWCKLMITPSRGALVESRDHLIFGHNPQMWASEVVRMRIPRTWVWKRGTEESIPCMLESNSWISMEGQVTGTSHSDSQPWLWMTSGRSVSAKSAKMTQRSKWTTR